MNRKRLERSVNSSVSLSSSLRYLSPFLCILPLSQCGYLFTELQEQTVMQTHLLWGLNYISSCCCLRLPNNVIEFFVHRGGRCFSRLVIYTSRSDETTWLQYIKLTLQLLVQIISVLYRVTLHPAWFTSLLLFTFLLIVLVLFCMKSTTQIRM